MSTKIHQLPNRNNHKKLVCKKMTSNTFQYKSKKKIKKDLLIKIITKHHHIHQVNLIKNK